MPAPKRRSVIFLATSAFAVPCLQALATSDDFDVQLVITQPDKPVGRKRILTPLPVKIAAAMHGLPIAQPQEINEEWDTALHPDFLIVASYGQILSQVILDAPRIAPVNVHASLLPRWRGASPIQHALLAGDAETGVTVQRMVLALDAGPILAKTSLPIRPRENAATLHDRLATAAPELLLQTLHSPLRERPQEGPVSFCHKLTRQDGKAEPSHMTAEQIDRRVRALTPWPGVTMMVEGHPLKVLESSLEPSPEALAVPCAEGSALFLVSVQPPGRTPMSGAAWSRGK